MRSRVAVVLVVGLLFYASPAGSPLQAQGVLERVREEVRSNRSGDSSPAPASEDKVSASNTSGERGWSDDTNDSSLEAYGMLGLGAGAIAASPVWVPFLLLNDRLAVPAYFPGHPYAAGEGYLHIDRNGFGPEANGEDFLDPASLKRWAVRLSVEDGNDFDGLNRLGGRLVVDTSTRFGLETSWNHFYESLPCGCTDETVLGDGYLTVRFAQSEWMHLRAGLGFRLLADRQETRGGFSCLYGMDLFPVKPLVLSALVDLGNLDNAFVIHARGTVGVNLGRAELFTGYDFLRVGSVNLQGPLVGVRFWF